jgi:hypothetical protein
VTVFDLLLASGRGDDPSSFGGIAIIVGIVVVAVVGGFVLHAVWGRFGRSRHDAKRRPQPPGRVGRSSGSG